eukprot:TRINITY_DN350_c0_g4_i1.p1 TRINITY_DN350_c0_g4~~TRINITY_DN350_c0_g4_i1.p1  ORF type:complete len:386 (+),score=18.76 TRINITY_DN350_c0_g4_i1:62-1219(+)
MRAQTEDVNCVSTVFFSDFHLNHKLILGLHEAGFVSPTPIQEACIPSALSGVDILGRSKNGTGKTGAYLIPILESLLSADGRIAVVVVPTRELALQVSHIAKSFSKYLDLAVVSTFGGTSVRDDVIRLCGNVNLIIGTPGRLLDLMERGVISLSCINSLVLDEADRLLTEEFFSTCQKISLLLAHHQTYLFSATFPSSIQSKISLFVQNAKEVNMMPKLTLSGVSQFYSFVEEQYKIFCLHSLFKKLQINQMIIFCNSVNRVELLARKITEIGYSCFFIHSRMPQNERNRVFHDFRNGDSRVLVSTDLFTRGIDIPSVNVVINFDLPEAADSYLHRIGRSGRYGQIGLAINLITFQDRIALFEIEESLGTIIEPLPALINHSLYN